MHSMALTIHVKMANCMSCEFYLNKKQTKKIHYHQHSKYLSDPTAWDDKECEFESQVYYFNVWPLEQTPSPA